jgi:hypothetical protein
MVTGPSDATAFVLTVNVALCVFAGTVTAAGTVALFVSVLSSETAKLAGAGPLIARVAVDGLPPRTGDASVSPLTVGG